MKTTSKVVLAVLLIGTLALGACSRTKDALGLDAMYNAISSGRWYGWTTTMTPGTSMNNLQPDQYIEFSKSNGTAFVYDKDGTQVGVKHTFSFTDTKTMIFDNVTYKIRENFAGSFKTLTLDNTNGGVTTTQAFSR